MHTSMHRYGGSGSGLVLQRQCAMRQQPLLFHTVSYFMPSQLVLTSLLLRVMHMQLWIYQGGL